MKVDVEGHELAVFEGGSRALKEGRIRDIIFEETHGYPSPVTRLLEGFGFKIFRISREFAGRMLMAPETPMNQLQWMVPNFLTTRNPERAIELCQSRGWRVFC